jgi:hypothetical protein
MLQNLIHEGDMFGLVTTGPSSLSIQLTYDRDILNDALERITGDGMSPQRMLADSFGPNGGSDSIAWTTWKKRRTESRRG